MKTRTHLFGLGSLILLAWFTNLNAAPAVVEVVGELTHGHQVTIIGSDFGLKSPAKPYLWAPFEDSETPSPKGIVTKWSAISGMSHAAAEGVFGTGALKATDSSGNWTARVDGFEWTAFGQKSYLFRKTKRNFDIRNNFEAVYSFDQKGQINWKVVRLWPANTNYPNFYISTSNSAVVTEAGVRSGWLSSGETARGEVNAWKTEELELRSNSALSVSDGGVTFIVNGETVGSWSDWSFRNEASPSVLTQYYPVHGVKANVRLPDHYRYWVDDVYLDTTWARVMIGNHPELRQSTHREIQIPQTWSGTSITIEVNSISFPAGETPYLFVVDAHGQVSRGFAMVAIPLPDSPPDVNVE